MGEGQRLQRVGGGPGARRWEGVLEPGGGRELAGRQGPAGGASQRERGREPPGTGRGDCNREAGPPPAAPAPSSVWAKAAH